MFRYFQLLIFIMLCSVNAAVAQLVLKQSIEDCQILGLGKLNDGALLFTQGTNAKSLDYVKISNDGVTQWTSNLDLPSLGGYNFNMLQVFADNSVLFLIQQLEKYVLISKTNLTNGDEVYVNMRIEIEGNDEPLKWIVANGELYSVAFEDGVIISKKVIENELSNSQELIRFPTRYSENICDVFFTDSSTVYGGAYILERNHGKMHVLLNSYDVQTGKAREREHTLELKNTSYTYNSQYDLRVTYATLGNTGFYLMGKLDYHFTKPYPTTKVGDNHIGFWIAKFDMDLNLVYMSELPFQYFTGLVPADMIQKPAVIDIKEDANNGLFINVNEQQGVVYGNKYLIYLDSTGMYKSATGGKDEYNVLEYDQMGLRDVGRKSRIRLMNDYWPPFATNAFLYLANKPQIYSEEAENLLSLIKQNKRFTPQNWSYNFLTSGNQTLYFEYSDQKGGRLNIYSN